MNAREFNIIAETLDAFRGGSTDKLLWGAIVEAFCITLNANYPKTFDRDKFLKACGL